uniref:Uncharacterized protein n=1 Tax=Cryptomonas curvata TaxID=233186 RepID=A0A7S0QPJ6_9CRYP|mmetsp:Transcript_47533/g.99440  ORF Transcript_47533/g.99440 Transcript_47533/m.99440 type:complete len:156 (+) Transcript_47533:2-469(+)
MNRTWALLVVVAICIGVTICTAKTVANKEVAGNSSSFLTFPFAKWKRAFFHDVKNDGLKKRIKCAVPFTWSEIAWVFCTAPFRIPRLPFDSLDVEYRRRKAYMARLVEKHHASSKGLENAEKDWLIMGIWRIILKMLGFIRLDQMPSDSLERCEY